VTCIISDSINGNQNQLHQNLHICWLYIDIFAEIKYDYKS